MLSVLGSGWRSGRSQSCGRGLDGGGEAVAREACRSPDGGVTGP